MSLLSESRTTRTSIFTTVALSVILGLGAWLGHKTAENAERLAGMSAGLDAIRESAKHAEQSSIDGVTRLERKLDELVPRREFDARLLTSENDQRKADLRIREIDLEILKLKQERR